MDLAAFRATLERPDPPQGLPAALRALWWDAKGDWTRAHEAAQEQEGTPDCDWVHAYLHRREGDLGNAGYWYRAAGRPVASGPLDAEWAAIATALLGGTAPP